jgi:hypothetical protein
MRLFRDQQQRANLLEVSRFFGMLNHFPENVSGVGLRSGCAAPARFRSHVFPAAPLNICYSRFDVNEARDGSVFDRFDPCSTLLCKECHVFVSFQGIATVQNKRYLISPYTRK